MLLSSPALCLLVAVWLDYAVSWPSLKEREECPALEEEPWNYGDGEKGPSYWGETYPGCYGNSQSPIAISRLEAEEDPNLKPLSLVGLEKPVTSATLVNNGHTAMLTPSDGEERSIEVNGKKYDFSQLHFHWGDNYDKGSEHTLDGMRYAMEMHLVYTSADNEIAVVGVLFQEGRRNKAIQPIIKALPDISYKGMTKNLSTSLDLSGLIPCNPLSYYRYQGSLTTPACNEGVQWTVAKRLASISHSQMRAFRNLNAVSKAEDNGNCKLVNNFRPVQPMNDRKVYSSTQR